MRSPSSFDEIELGAMRTSIEFDGIELGMMIRYRNI